MPSSKKTVGDESERSDAGSVPQSSVEPAGVHTRPLIYDLLPKVAMDVGAIGKKRRNEQQSYNFRGIDDVLDAIHEPLCRHGVTPTTRVFDVKYEIRPSSRGTPQSWILLMLEVTWNAPDGSSLSTVTAGEALDSGDKATNKAMSAALKYAYFQTFSIPLNEGDADSESPELGPRGPLSSAPATPPPLSPPPLRPDTPAMLAGLVSLFREMGCTDDRTSTGKADPGLAAAVVGYCSAGRSTLDDCRIDPVKAEDARVAIEMEAAINMKTGKTREEALRQVVDTSIEWSKSQNG